MNKGYISEIMGAARVLAHGKIKSLESGFSLRKGQPFSLFIIPKDEEEFEPVVISVKLYQDDTVSDCPFNLRCWNEPAVTEIEASGIDLGDYDVYWGSGSDVEES